MKKLVVFGLVIVALFASLAIVTNMKQSKQAEGNPYGKSKLHPATVELLDDPNYSNVIVPEQLSERLDNKESLVVYFYQSTCPYCQELTPRLMPLADEKGVHIEQYNLLEFEEGWRDYQIESTPTLVYFESGEEKDRVVGADTNEVFAEFFEKHKLAK